MIKRGLRKMPFEGIRCAWVRKSWLLFQLVFMNHLFVHQKGVCEAKGVSHSMRNSGQAESTDESRRVMNSGSGGEGGLSPALPKYESTLESGSKVDKGYADSVSRKAISEDLRLLNDDLKKVRRQDLLTSLEVKVGGKSRFLKHGDILEVFEFDELTVIAGKLASGNTTLDVNVLGLKGRFSSGIYTDCGIGFKFSDLLKKWSIQEDGKIYKVDVKKEREVVGRVYLRSVEPIIKYLTFEVDGKKQIVRNQQFLDISSMNTFRLIDIETNIHDLSQITQTTEKLLYHPSASGSIENPYDYYRIIFKVADKPLAVVPLRTVSNVAR